MLNLKCLFIFQIDGMHAINSVIRGRTRECEYDVTGLQNVTVVHTILPKEIHVKPFEHTTHLYLLSVDLNPETADYSFAQGLKRHFICLL